MSINKSEALHVAAQCFLKGDLTAAVDIHRKIIESDPHDLAPIISLSDLYVRARRPGEALNFLSRTAHDLLSEGFRLKAAHILQKRLEIDPSDTSVLMELGEIYSHEGMIDRSHEMFVTAGVGFLRKSDMAQALNAYKTALIIKPDSRQAAVAIALLTDDITSTAASDLSSSAEPNETTGICVSEDPPPEGADAIRSPAHQTLKNDDIVQKISMAERLVGFGKVHQAVAMLKELLKHAPENVDVHIKLKDIYLRTAEVDKAAEECLEISRIYSSRGELASAKEYMVRMRLLSTVTIDSSHEPLEVQMVAEPANDRFDQELRSNDTASALVPNPWGGEKPIISIAPGRSNNWSTNTSLSILDTESSKSPRANKERRPRLYAVAITAACLAVLSGALTKGVLMYEVRLDRQYEALALASPPVVAPPLIASFDQPPPGEEVEAQAIVSPVIQPDTPPQPEREDGRMSAKKRPDAPFRANAPSTTIGRVLPAPPVIMPIPNQQESSDRGGRTPEGIPTGMPSNATGAPDPPPPPPTPQSGGVIKAVAIRKVDPVYPSLAKSSRQSGKVTVEVNINERGDVVSARAVSGPPLLRGAAVAAAKGWKFKPCTLSGKPIPSVNFITFNFKS
jgi:protein TonB